MRSEREWLSMMQQLLNYYQDFSICSELYGKFLDDLSTRVTMAYSSLPPPVCTFKETVTSFRERNLN